MSSAIQIDGLTKVYGYGTDEVKAVDGLDLTVEQGEVFGFLGPNGAGKTTTVLMLMQIIFPSAGSASILGKPLGDIDVRSQVGYLPEQFRFHSFLRADEFLDFHARLYGMPSSLRKSRVEEILKMVGLTDNARSRIRTFSKGMLQRIGIGQAVINNPKLLFLDEPTSALDPMGRRDVRDLIKRLTETGTTIFLNSHLLSEVEMVCGRVGIMKKGKLTRVSDMESLVRPAHVVDIRAENLPPEALEAIRTIADEFSVGDDSKITATVDREEKLYKLAEVIMNSGANLKEFTPKQKPLEEVFIEEVEGSD